MFDSVHIIIMSEIFNYLGANSEKPEKYFRLKINRIAWKMEKIVSRSTLKNIDYEIFWSASFSIRTFKGRTRVAKGWPAFRDRITSHKLCIER